MNKPVCASRTDGLFVEAHCVNVAAVDASNLGADQRGAIVEILGAVHRPDFELPVMSIQSRGVLLALAGRSGVADGSVTERRVEMVFRRLHGVVCYPEQRLRPRCGMRG
jgi:hypothetical protein